MTEQTKQNQQQQQVVVVANQALQESDEDCPLCCNSMTIGDLHYPLLCPTVSCSFNYCTNCLLRFMKAAADGYQLASDGSNQVKINVKCPMCRSKYEIPTSTTNSNTNNIPNYYKYSSDIIIQSLLLLRNAAYIETLLSKSKTDDSNLNASDLSKRNEFIRDTSMEEIESAYGRIQTYYRSLASIATTTSQRTSSSDKEQTTNDDLVLLNVIPLDWTLFRTFLREKRQHQSNNDDNNKDSGISKNDSSDGNNNNNNNNTSLSDTTNTAGPPWKDPTLFGGLEELMTSAEHEFISSMMISGQVETVAQAATILHGIMELSSSRRAQLAIQQMSNTVGATPSNNNNNSNTTNQQVVSASARPVRLSTKEVEFIQRTRRRFPLPINMPRCFAIPLYDPIHDKKPLLHFEKDKNADKSNTTASDYHYTLQLKSINGYAGRIGLRKGDVVTHVDGNAIETFSEFVTILQQHLVSSGQLTQSSSSTPPPSIQIVVNATTEIATALRQRYIEMKQKKNTFPL